MKTSKSTTEKGTIELEVELERADIEKYLKRAAEHLASHASIDGFRKGNAPYDVVCRHVGGEAVVYQEALQAIVGGTLPGALKELPEEIIGQPDIMIQKMVPPFGVSYKATLMISPAVQLGSYEALKVKKQDTAVDDKEVEQVLRELREMRAEEKSVERTAQKGDVVELDIVVKQNGVPIENGASKGTKIILGEERFIPGFEDKIVGVKKDETRTFELIFPERYHEKSLAGKPAEFDVHVAQVSERILPELTDDFVKSLGHADTVVDMKKQVRERLAHEKESEAQEKFQIACMEALAKESKIETIPDGVIDNEVLRMLQEMKQHVAQQGIAFDDYLKSLSKSEDDLKKDFRHNATERVKLSLVAKAYGGEHKITISEKDVDAEVAMYKKAYQNQPQILTRLDSDEYRDEIRSRLQSRKIFGHLAEQVGKK